MAIDTDAMVTAAQAPPRSTRGAARGSVQRAKSQASENARRREVVEGVFQLGSMACLMAGQYADSAAIAQHGGNIAQEAANLADTNEGLAKGIDYLTTVGPYAAILTACLPLALQIAANHKMIKAEAFAGAGVVSPDILESKMKADMIRQQTEAVKAQRDAQRALDEAVADAQQAANAPANGQAPQ